MTHYVISTSYGNDSVAMIQWAHEVHLDLFGSVSVVYCDTGWAAPGWMRRVEMGEAFARSKGFDVVRTQSMGMEELVRFKQGFPGNGQQFCTAWLKGLPFLGWIDEVDMERQAVVMIGKRRAESEKRKDTPEFIEQSEYHGERKVWHPLYLHSDQDRDALLLRAGIPYAPEGVPYDDHDRLYILPHRSDECSPCVNANRGDFMRLQPVTIQRVNRLEVEIGKPMFRPKRFHGLGIYGVMTWAKYGKDKEVGVADDEGCGSPFGCRT